MGAIAYALVLLHAVAMSSWFITQQALFSRGMTKSTAMMVTGLGMVFMIAISWVRWRRGIPRKVWVWFAVTIIVNVIVAECLVSATKEYGASLGANAMGLAPVAAVFFGWLLLDKELPGNLGLLGIGLVFAGVYLLHVDPTSWTNLLVPLGAMSGSWLWYTVCLSFAAGLGLVTAKPSLKATDEFMQPGVVLLLSWGVYGLIKAVSLREVGELALLADGTVVLLTLLTMLGFVAAQWSSAMLYRYTAAASVGALKRLYLPGTTLMAWLFFGWEPQLASILVGSLVILSGAVVISLDRPVTAFSQR